MKSVYVSATIQASKWLGVLALAAVAAGCERRQNEPTPEQRSGEAPGEPRISPARPATEAGGTGATGTAEPAKGPDSAAEIGSMPDSERRTGDADRREAKADFKTAKGYKLSGDAELKETPEGVIVVVELEDAPPGKKGIHVHEKGDCSDIPGKSMGEHFAPDVKQHGLPPSSHHLGDLGNIAIGEDGKARFEFTARKANLKDKDPMSFLGRAIVIHEAEDKGTQPSGASGKPIACAVIEKD